MISNPYLHKSFVTISIKETSSLNYRRIQEQLCILNDEKILKISHCMIHLYRFKSHFNKNLFFLLAFLMQGFHYFTNQNQ